MAAAPRHGGLGLPLQVRTAAQADLVRIHQQHSSRVRSCCEPPADRVATGPRAAGWGQLRLCTQGPLQIGSSCPANCFLQEVKASRYCSQASVELQWQRREIVPGATATQQRAYLASMTSAPASSSLWRVTSAASTTRAALRLMCTSWGSGSRCCSQSEGVHVVERGECMNRPPQRCS